jgi:hypothetical protein
VSRWSNPAFGQIVERVAAHLGLNAGARRTPDAEARVRRAMTRAQVADVSRYLQLLERPELPLDDLRVRGAHMGGETSRSE